MCTARNLKENTKWHTKFFKIEGKRSLFVLDRVFFVLSFSMLYIFVCVFLAGELQRDDISIFVFQRGTIVATCRAHRSLVGASCEFLGALWEAGSS